MTGPRRELQGRRIAVIGQSGSGKSTLARALSAKLGIPHIELDAINWGPGWVGLSVEDPDRFVTRVSEAISEEAWVVDGNYRKAQPVIMARATDVVWLDYSRPLIMARVIRRSFARALDQRELWPGTGNRETFARWLDKTHPIRWSWDTYETFKADREARLAEPAVARIRQHRLRTQREAATWLSSADVGSG